MKAKSYTDLNQSKKLAEILPIESADHHYVRKTCDFMGNPVDGKWSEPKYGNPNSKYANYMVQNFTSYETIPCWSLAALLSILPTTIGNFFEKNALRLRMDKGENDFNIWYENFDCGDVAEGLDVIEDNPVDACYEMILKLHEQKLL